MRTAKVLDRLKAEQAKNPDVPHYDSMGTPWPQPPSDVKTAGYWKLEGRRPARGEQPCAFVVSGHGSSYNPTGWVAAYHLSQTVEIRRRQAAPQPERLTTAARPIAPEPLPLIEDDRDETRQRLDSLARLLERAPLGGQVLYLDTETTGLARPPTTCWRSPWSMSPARCCWIPWCGPAVARPGPRLRRCMASVPKTWPPPPNWRQSPPSWPRSSRPPTPW